MPELLGDKQNYEKPVLVHGSHANFKDFDPLDGVFSNTFTLEYFLEQFLLIFMTSTNLPSIRKSLCVGTFFSKVGSFHAKPNLTQQ